MDMFSITGAASGQNYTSQRFAPVAAGTIAAAEPVAAKPAASEPAIARISSDDQRLAMVEQAAKKVQDVYVVSDTSFSIFKDATGQFITRFRNLRDGTVTYIPEPNILQYARQGSRAAEPQVEVEA